MKVRELMERLQQMEQDATVTVRINTLIIRNGLARPALDEVRIQGAIQNGAGANATTILEPEDKLTLYGGTK